MALKLSVYIATSLDGFIAREDGNLDWLDAASATVPEGEDCGYAEFMESVDVLVMGRNTYEKVRSFGDWPYDKKVIVLSRKPLDIPQDLKSRIEHSSEPPHELTRRLSAQGLNRLYIDGGLTIQRFLAAGLIDDMTITVIPILLGNGISLFADLEKDVALKHIETTTYDFGFVKSFYQIIRSAK